MTVSQSNETYRYSKSAKIDKEGIYYTLLVYAPVNYNQTNNYSVFGDEELYRESELDKKALDDKNYLKISGEVELSNSFGYLSADEQPLIRFYSWMALIYFVIDAFWIFLCLKHFD